MSMRSIQKRDVREGIGECERRGVYVLCGGVFSFFFMMILSPYCLSVFDVYL